MMDTTEKGYKQAMHVLYREDFKNEDVFDTMLIHHGVERPCEVDELTIWATVTSATNE